MQKINGWKIYHLAAGMEDIVDMESELSKRLQEVRMMMMMTMMIMMIMMMMSMMTMSMMTMMRIMVIWPLGWRTLLIWRVS